MYQKSLNTAKGSVIAEAAVTLPVFIISMVLLFSLISQASAEDRLYKKLAEEANFFSAAIAPGEADIPFLLAMGATGKNNVTRMLLYRPFVGESYDFGEEYVYIYPKSGKRYHVIGCSTIDNNGNYEKVSLSEAEERGFSPCRLCCNGGIDYFKKYKMLWN